MAIRWQGKVLLLSIVVQPNAKQTRVVGMYQEHIKIQIIAPAIENKANLFLSKWLASEFGVANKSVTLEKGQLSRFKVFSINAPSNLPEWFNALQRLNNDK